MESNSRQEKTDHHEHCEDLTAEKTIDTLHNDEAIKVLATYGSDEVEWGSDEERKLVRKIDRKLVPLMFLSYGLVYYDKAMISQAVSTLDTSNLHY